jgi:hypothetical protein
MTQYKITYYTELGYSRRTLKQLPTDITLAAKQAEKWCNSLGLMFHKLEKV